MLRQIRIVPHCMGPLRELHHIEAIHRMQYLSAEKECYRQASQYQTKH